VDVAHIADARAGNGASDERGLRPFSLVNRFPRPSLAAVAALLVAGCSGYGKPFKVGEFTHDEVGVFRLGERKGEILARLPGESFMAVDPSGTCATRWLLAREVDASQRRCLDKVSVWESGTDSTKVVCGRRPANWFTTLGFTGDVLTKVTVRCFDPE
jgi:hypothetical protein